MQRFYRIFLSVFIFLQISWAGFGQCPITISGESLSVKSNISCFGGSDGIMVLTFNPILSSQVTFFDLRKCPDLSCNPASSTTERTVSVGSGISYSSVTFTGVSSGSYFVRLRRICGQLNILNSSTVIIRQPLIPDDLIDDEICFGNQLQPIGSDPAPGGGIPPSVGTWIISGGSGSPTISGVNSTNPTMGNFEVGTYTITWNFSVPGCNNPPYPNNSKSFQLTVNPIPTITSALNATVCSGLLFNYTAVGSDMGSGNFYYWDRNAVAGISNPSSIGNINNDGIISETLINTTSAPINVFYELTQFGRDFTNCSPLLPYVLTVTVNPTPTAVSTPTSAAICTNQALNFSLSSNLANTTFSWTTSVTSGSVGGISSGTGATISQVPTTADNQARFLYLVTPLNTLTGCGSLMPFQIPVTVNGVPTVLGTNYSVCGFSAASALLTTNGTSFQWSNGSASNPASLVPVSLGNNIFQATITSGVGCRTTTTVGVFAQTPVTVSSVNATVCGLTSANVSVNTNATTINWFNNATTASISVTPTVIGINNYPVTLTSGVCSVVTVASVLAQPTVTVSSQNYTVCGLSPQSALLTTNGTSFAWSNGQTTNPAILTPVSFGNNVFIATVSSGLCRATTTVTVNAIAIPTVSGVNATVCGLISTNISVNTNAPTIRWFNNASTASISVTPSVLGINNYPVTLTSGICSVTTTVSVLAQPPVTVTGNITTVCGTSPVNVSVTTNGTNFIWNTGATTNPISVTPALGLNTYTVTVSSAGGCSAITTAGIFAIAPITVTSSLTTVCGLGTASVSVTTNGTAFNWFNGNTTSSTTATASSLGLNTFPVTITSGICRVTTTAGIFAQTPVTVSSVNATVCGLTSANVSVNTNATTINWFNNATTASISVTPTVIGINNYPVTLTSGVCSVVTVASVLAQPTVTVSSQNYTVCGLSPQSALLTTNGTSFAWSNGQTTNPATLTPSLVGNNTFSVTVLSGLCSATASVNVFRSEITASQAGITAQNNSCIAPNGMITVSGTSNVNISNILLNGALPNTFSTSTGIASALFTGLGANTYVPVITNALGCSTTLTGLVINAPTVPSAPIISAQPSGNYCEGQPVPALVYTASNGTIGLYSTSGLFLTTLSSGIGFSVPTVVGSYGFRANVTVNGCVSPFTGNTTYTVSPSPSISTLIGNNLSGCNSNDGSITVVGTATNYSNGFTSNTTGIFSGLSPITYQITASIGACSVTSSITLSAPGQPAAPVLSGGNSYCAGQSVALLTATGTGTGLYGLYNSLNNLIEIRNVSGTAVFSTTSPGTYYANVTVAGCFSAQSNTQNIQINPIPVITLSGNNPICSGNVVTVTANVGLGATYSWTGSQTGNTATFNTAGLKTVNTTLTGCSASLNFVITVNSNPTVTISLSGNNVCPNTNVSVTGNGALFYGWGLGLSSFPMFTTPGFTVPSNVNSFNISVIGYDINGCTDIDIVTLSSRPTVSGLPALIGASQRCSGSGSGTYQLPNPKSFYNATTLGWAISSGAGTISPLSSPNDHIANVTWNAAFSGVATLSVTGFDDCGNSQTSTFNVTVSSAPTVSSVTKTDPSTCSASDGSITVVAVSGGNPINYILNTTTLTSGVFTGLGTNPSATYSIIVSDQITGCTVQVSTTLSPVGTPAEPILTILGNNTICQGSPIPSLGASSTVSGILAIYQSPSTLLSSASGVSNLNFTPSSAGTFFATFSDGACVSGSSNTQTITIDVVTISSAISSVSICEGESTLLSVSGNALTYVWYQNTSLVGAGNSITVSPSTSTIYTLTATGAAPGSCTTALSFSVNVNAKPSATLNNITQTVCGTSASLGLTQSGAVSVTLFDGISNFTAPVSGSLVNVTFSGNTTFTLLSVSGASCANTASGVASIVKRADTDPICTCTGQALLLGGSGAKCEGSSSSYDLVISVTGTSPLSVELLQNGDINNRLTFTGLNPGLNSNLSVSPDVTTDYSIYVVNTASCQGAGSGTVRVTVTPVPNLSVTSPVSVSCSTTSVDLNSYFVDLNTTLTGNVTFWADANYTQPISNIVTSSGTYFIRKTSFGGSTCSGEAAITINFQNRPTATVVSGSSVCSGTGANFNVFFSGGTAPYQFIYGDGSFTSATINSGNIYTATVPGLASVYTVSGISDANGCAISVSGAAVVSLNPTSVCGNNTCTLPAEPTITGFTAECGNIVINWDAVGFNAFIYNLVTSVSGFSRNSTIVGNSITFTGVPDDRYFFTINSINNCGVSTNDDIDFVMTPKFLGATITGGGQVCFGTPASLIFNLEGTPPFRNFQFSQNLVLPILDGVDRNTFQLNINAAQTTVFSIVGFTDATGCSRIGSSVGTSITPVDKQPASAVVTSKYTASCDSSIFTFTAMGINAGNKPRFTWLINGNTLSGLGSYFVIRDDTVGGKAVLEIQNLSNGDTVSVAMQPDSAVLGCVLNANNIKSNEIYIKIRNIGAQATYIPTSCLNSNDGILSINIPSENAGRTFDYTINEITGTGIGSFTVGGLNARGLSITINDKDNPRCTEVFTTAGTGTTSVNITQVVENPSCSGNDGKIRIAGISNSYSFYTLELKDRSNDSTKIYPSLATNTFYVITGLGIGSYTLFNNYGTCRDSVSTLALTGGSAPFVDLGPDIRVCKGDSILITTSGVATGTFTWFKNNVEILTGSVNYLPVRINEPGIYSVNVPGTNGCISTDFVSVFVSEVQMRLATTALTNDTLVTARWKYVNEADLPDTALVVEYRTLFENNIVGPWSIAGLASVGDTLFTHRNDLANAIPLQYRLVGLNDPVCAAQPHEMVFLQGKNNEEEYTVSLNWSRYKGWEKGVERYEVWRKMDDENTFTLLRSAGTDTTIELTDVREGFKHQYRILTISKEAEQDSIKSWSNILSLSFSREVEPFNAFSPNGDGVNDEYKVKNIEAWKNAEIFIFNRWGGKVYYAKPYNNDWKGEGMTDGTYFYIIKLNDSRQPKPFKGSILLQR